MIEQQDQGEDDGAGGQLVERCLGLVRADIDNLSKLIADLNMSTDSSQSTLQVGWGRGKIATSGAMISQMRGYVDNSLAVLCVLQTSRTQ
jgi:hypothetical protein